MTIALATLVGVANIIYDDTQVHLVCVTLKKTKISLPHYLKVIHENATNKNQITIYAMEFYCMKDNIFATITLRKMLRRKIQFHFSVHKIITIWNTNIN